MDDVVKQLRGMSGFYGTGGAQNMAIAREAAEEIERLRSVCKTALCVMCHLPRVAPGAMSEDIDAAIKGLRAVTTKET